MTEDLSDEYLDAPEAKKPTPREAELAHRKAVLADIPQPKVMTVAANKMILNERMNPIEDVQWHWVHRFVQNWTPALADPMRLLARGRTYEIIDGRHRWLAVRELGLKSYRFVCFVHSGLTESQEAALFGYFNDERRNVTQKERFNSKLLHQDPLALRIQRVLDETGLRPACFGTMRAMILRASDLDEGEMMIRFTLTTLDAAFPTEAPTKRFNSNLVKGFGLFYLKYNQNPNLDVETLVERIHKGRKTAEQVIKWGFEVGSTSEGAAGGIRRWLVQRHDAGRRDAQRLEPDMR